MYSSVRSQQNVMHYWAPEYYTYSPKQQCTTGGLNTVLYVVSSKRKTDLGNCSPHCIGHISMPGPDDLRSPIQGIPTQPCPTAHNNHRHSFCSSIHQRKQSKMMRHGCAQELHGFGIGKGVSQITWGGLDLVDALGQHCLHCVPCLLCI